ISCLCASHYTSLLLSSSPSSPHLLMSLFFFNATAPTEIYTLSLHDALPISARTMARQKPASLAGRAVPLRPIDLAVQHRLARRRSEEHTSELQSLTNLVCRLLLEKKKKKLRQQRRRQADVATTAPSTLVSDR